MKRIITLLVTIVTLISTFTFLMLIPFAMNKQINYSQDDLFLLFLASMLIMTVSFMSYTHYEDAYQKTKE